MYGSSKEVLMIWEKKMVRLEAWTFSGESTMLKRGHDGYMFFFFILAQAARGCGREIECHTGW